MRILSDRDITDLLTLDQIVEAVHAALVAYEEGQASVLQRLHMDHGANSLLCMPAMEQSYFGTKLVSVVPGNKDHDLPVTNGAMLLNDASTGLPLALLNASKLTALRTGAVGAIGLQYITPADSTSIGLIGCGVQGLHQAIFACTVRKISKVYCYCRSNDKSAGLASLIKLHHPHVEVEACRTPEDLLAKTNIVIAATSSAGPVLPDDAELLKGKHFISIGSYKPSMQELPDSVYQLAGALVIDSEFARHEVGDIINPIKKGILREADVFTLGKLISGARMIDTQATTVFKSAGMALFDLFVARAMYEEAVKENKGTEVSW